MTEQNKIIAGQGGGGGKAGGGSARTPVEQPDNLRSIQFARVIDLVSEGEIFGLVDGMKSIFLDDTPIQNADDTFNFSGVSIFTTKGTQAQPIIPGFLDTEAEVAVSTVIKNGTPISRTITDADTDAVRVTIAVQNLTTVNTKNGDINGGSFNLKIEVDDNGGGFVEKINDVITGKTTTQYLRAYRIELTPGGNPWTIKVTRITANSTSSRIVNEFSWSSYTRLIDEKINYPNSALVGLDIDAAQFSTIPRRSYDLKLLKVKIPVNYDPLTRVYSPSVWDGTFKVDWTDNPAWAFYDLVTETRYGLGDFITSDQIDKFALFEIAQYCDTLVDDGVGGQEPRFTINAYFQTAGEAYKVLMNLASVFRGMLYWAGGQLVPVQDKPEDASYQFTDANVENGLFNYTGTAKSARHTVALVGWNDPNQRYERKIEYIDDKLGIARFGINTKEITGLGVASRGQANRVGRWLLLSERLETETVSFISGLEGTGVQPGQIVDILDSKRKGVRGGGRIVSATKTVIDIDATITLEVAKTYELQVILPDGTVEEETVTTGAGDVTQLTVDTPYTFVPSKDAVWILSTDNLVKESFRILSIVEVGKNKHEIVAIQHDATKFALTDSGIQFQALPTDESLVIVASVVNISFRERTIQDRGETNLIVSVDWDAVVGAVEYNVKYKPLNGNYQSIGKVTASFAEFIVPGPDTYTVEIIAINSFGIQSLPTVATAIITGRADTPPPRVTGLEIFGQGNGTEFFGRDAKFVWRDQSTFSQFELGQEPAGAGDGAPDPFFKDYEVRILKDGVLLRVAHTTDPTFSYTFENNAEDFSLANPGQTGANRSFTIEVYARGKQNQLSVQKAGMTVSNPPPALPSGVTLRASDNFLFFQFDEPDEVDFVGTEVYVSTTGGFTPSSSNLYIASPDYGISIDDRATETQYFIRFRPFDSFGRVGLNQSSELSVTTTANLADIAVNSITADKYNELRNSQLLFFDDSLDNSVPFEIFFPISSEMIAIERIVISFKIKNYRALAKTALDGGGQTSSSGGAENPTSSGGGATTPTSAQNAIATHTHFIANGGSVNCQYQNGILTKSTAGNVDITSSTVDGHSHKLRVHQNISGGATMAINGGIPSVTGGATLEFLSSQGHTHYVTLGGIASGGLVKCSTTAFGGTAGSGLTSTANNNAQHTHTVTIGNHTHTVSISNHTHTVADHTHPIDFGITEVVNTSPSIGVFVDNGSGFGSDLGPFTADQLEFDLTSQFSGTGFKAIKFTGNKLFRIVGVLELKLDLSA